MKYLINTVVLCVLSLGVACADRKEPTKSDCPVCPDKPCKPDKCKCGGDCTCPDCKCVGCDCTKVIGEGSLGFDVTNKTTFTLDGKEITWEQAKEVENAHVVEIMLDDKGRATSICLAKDK